MISPFRNGKANEKAEKGLGITIPLPSLSYFSTFCCVLTFIVCVQRHVGITAYAKIVMYFWSNGKLSLLTFCAFYVRCLSAPKFMLIYVGCIISYIRKNFQYVHIYHVVAIQIHIKHKGFTFL